MMKLRLVIIYDGISNPVFHGQVVAPLARHLHEHPDEHGMIISFEKNLPADTRTLSTGPSHTTITLKTLPQMKFVGALALQYAARHLRSVLKHLANTYTITSIIARGAFAGYVVALCNEIKHIPLIIQARGLAAEEYRFSHAHHSFFTKLIHQFRAWQMECIERWVYGTYARQPHVVISSVSDALSSYLMHTYRAPADKIRLETHDLPAPIAPAICATWKEQIRNKLAIPHDAYVYVYNGSAKPWQCPQESVELFFNEYQKNRNAILLVLTQDVHIFKTLLTNYPLSQTSYRILHVAHAEIYHYLSAADAGLLLRQPHIINWVSRPTKALEYQSVGLHIIHNNTVGMLQKKSPMTNHHEG